MIRREAIKQAIDAISKRTPEVGYTLDEMLGSGIIDAPEPGGETMLGDDFFFFFDHYRTRVSKFLYIHKGTVPIEERLLVKYGEMLKKRELLDRGEMFNTPAAVKTIRQAGLRFMVHHEIDYAIARIQQNGGAAAASLIPFLETVKRQIEPLVVSPNGGNAAPLYNSVVDVSTPADFMRFPFCMDSLLQVADINLEFFHVRFFLNRLIRGQIQNCYVCLVDSRIIGIIYLIFKEQMLVRNLVIDFIATLRGKSGDPGAAGAPRGVGTFLIAGVWLEWKTGVLKARDLVLDSEVAARGFYESLGFHSRGFAEFVLKTPGPHLLRSIITMKPFAGSLPSTVVHEIEKLIESQIKSLRIRPKTEREVSDRKAALETVKKFLRSDAYADVTEKAVQMLLKHQRKIPESEALLQGCRLK